MGGASSQHSEKMRNASRSAVQTAVDRASRSAVCNLLLLPLLPLGVLLLLLPPETAEIKLLVTDDREASPLLLLLLLLLPPPPEAVEV
jgi:hypothetical protein